MLRFPDFEHNWESKKLKDLSNIQRGASPRPITAKKWYDNENKKVGWVRIGDVTSSSKYLTKTEDYFSEEGVKKSRFLPKGSLIMSICATIGKPIVTGMDTCIHDGFVGFSELKNINKEFLYYYLNILEPKFISLSQTGSQANLNSDLVRNAEIGVPSIQEQEKIVNFISAVDKKHNILNKNLETQLSFKRYLMQQIFTQKLRFDFNDEWKNIPFKKLLKEVNEKTTVNNQHEILSSTKEGIFTQKDYFADRNVASKDNTGYKVLRKNQIVLSPQNLWMGNINVNTEFDIGIVSPSYKIYETTDLIDINYFKHIVKLPRLIYEYTCASEQGASIVRRNLNKQLFNEITIKVPSLNEQKKIGNLFDTCDEKIKNIDKNIQDMKEFKKGLLQQMFV
ncbi:MAG: restriction endonuclease subunit S [Methanobrevibacter smithii]|nr:restriction endonuclease subunit S [Methanobrevibacter smithii]MEE0719537.1 restriction endonuclease subunit S [Methanobrevibacter smithii]